MEIRHTREGMKTKVILYGWAVSWLFLFAGIGTMDSGNYVTGMFLFLVWVAFSLLLMKNENECRKELDRFDRWMYRILGGKDKNQRLGLN